MDSLAESSVTLCGRTRRVKILEVTPENSALIDLDGKIVEVVFPQRIQFNELVRLKVNGKNYKVKLNKGSKPTTFEVKVYDRRFVLDLESKRRRLNNQPSFTVPPMQVRERRKPIVKKDGAVTAVMPGKVVLLKVKVGDRVKSGDPLCVLEAMKMENEIVAPRSGAITQVGVEQGSFVNKGDLLVIIE